MPVTKPVTLPRWAETVGGVPANTTPAPMSGDRDVGWGPGQKVLNTWANGLFNTLYHWAQWLDSLETQAITWTAVQTFSLRDVHSDGILVNAPATSNRPGVDATGNGTGPAVKGTAANNASSSGVEGVGVGAAPGGRFSGPSTGAAVLAAPTGSGTALKGDASGGTGKAVEVIGNTTVEAMTVTAGGNQRAATFVAAGTGAFGMQLDVSGGTHAGLWLVGNATRAPLQITVQAADPSTLADGMVWINSTAGKVRARIGGATVDLN